MMVSAMEEDSHGAERASIEHISARLEEVERRIQASDNAENGDSAGGAPPMNGHLYQALSAFEYLTNRSEKIAQRWAAVPALIGILVVIVGLSLLANAAMFKGAEGSEYVHALWGGVVLIAVGTASATAACLVAKVEPEADGRPPVPLRRFQSS